MATAMVITVTLTSAKLQFKAPPVNLAGGAFICRQFSYQQDDTPKKRPTRLLSWDFKKSSRYLLRKGWSRGIDVLT
jgi:hypothetical protein